MTALIISMTFGFGLCARLVSLPPLVGFLMAGFALRAMGVPENDLVQAAADLGVTLLMFVIGLKLKVHTLAKPVVWAGTLLHSTLTVVIFAVILFGLGTTGVSTLTGLDLRTVVLIAFALSFSSTVFAVKILEQNSDLGANYGTVAIGILIMQDLLAVGFLVFSTGALPTPLAIALLLLIPARPLLHRLASVSGHGELIVVCGLFLALVAGYGAFDATGVKGDLGALIIGVLVGSHPKSKELADSLFSVKEILLVGFFVSVGLSGELTWSSVGTAAILLLLVPIKMALYFIILTRFGLRARAGTLATLTLANFSEFGLIVTAMGVELGWLAPDWLVIIALALSASLVLASPVCARSYRIYERFADRLRPFEGAAAAARVPHIDLQDVDVLIFGMGRVGAGAYRALVERFGSRVIGLDHDLDQVKRHQAAGLRVIHGDANDHELWDDMQARLVELPLIVLALPVHTSNLEVMRLLQKHHYDGSVAAVATFEDQVAQLRDAGVTTVHNYFDEAGIGLATHAMQALRGETPVADEPAEG